jgi:hypothetical protein
MTDSTTDNVKQGLSWLSLASNLLSILESLLPAFFVAWNNSIRAKNQALQQKVSLMQVKLDEANDAKKPASNASSRSTIDSFLRR